VAHISSSFRSRWRSANHVGAARPIQLVRIRRGEFRRRFDAWPGDDVNASMPGKSATKPWQAFWTPLDDWRELPNVVEATVDQDFDKNGTQGATVQIDNVFMAEQDAGNGPFHKILRGFFAPFRGYAVPWSPNKHPVGKNEWYRYLNAATQIEIWQGYGLELVNVYTGLTDSIDLSSAPDQVTITSRDFGMQLTDQRNIGYCKDRTLARKPTVFADRKHSEKVDHVGTAGPNDCSSSIPGHPARYVADKAGDTTSWISANRYWPDNTEYVQIRLPAGRYESWYMHPSYDGMECWVSVFSRGLKKHPNKVRVDGRLVDTGWLDLAGGDEIPGEVDGHHHYIKHYPTIGNEGAWHPLGHTLELGDDSVLRVSFRKLREVQIDGETRYRAGVRRLIAAKRKTVAEASKGKWILVDDVSDIVKVVLRWAGFKEWEIESTGVRVPEGTQWTFDHNATLMDIIKKCQDTTGFTFFMGDPSGNNDEYSIGVPIFRTPNVIGMFDLGREQIRDTDLLTGIQVRWDSSTLPEIIYIRGKETKRKGKKGRAGTGGIPFGEDDTLRIQASYRPPWTKRSATGGVIRHFVQTYNSLRTRKQLEVAARLVALNGALQSTTAIIEIPGNPAITLDSIVGVQDEGTGTNTRLYVASRSSVFHQSAETSWKMTLGGSLIDVPDVQEVVGDLFMLRANQENKEARGPHTSTAVAVGIGSPAVATSGQRQGRSPRRRRTRTRTR
jgi:hypothetical protein